MKFLVLYVQVSSNKTVSTQQAMAVVSYSPHTVLINGLVKYRWWLMRHRGTSASFLADKVSTFQIIEYKQQRIPIFTFVDTDSSHVDGCEPRREK